MLMAHRQGWTWVALLAMLGLGGCASIFTSSWVSGTQVDRNHHLVSASSEPLFATVYFIRPQTERAMGFSDNALTVKVDGRKLMTLEKGDYTLVYMRPRLNTTVTLENRTEVGPTKSSNTMSDADTPNWVQRGTWPTKIIAKNYHFDFAAGQSYFLVLEPEDGEFRGVHFVAKNVDLFTAKEQTRPLRAVGLAANQPLANL